MKYNIIYVDDEPENLRAFIAVFRRDYNIYTTDSPVQGLVYIRNNKIDLIITDQRMPEMMGVEFLRKVHEITPKKPPHRMILSAYSKTTHINEALEKEWASIYMSKPWDPQEMKMKIETALSES